MKSPIGIDNFGKLMRPKTFENEKFLYIDKTLFIKDFVNDSAEVVLFTRPRRFGKTLTLSMIQHFFSSEVFGESTQGLFDGLAISKIPGFMEKYQGKTPVIFISLKDFKQSKFEDMLDYFKNKIQELFREFEYLMDSEVLSAFNKISLEPYFTGKLNQAHITASLLTLSEMLYKHHGVRPHILIDEYDAPIQTGLEYGYFKEVTDIIRNMFGAALKTNPFLGKGVLTGVLQIAKESLFSGLNHFEVYNILNDSYSQYFGFTEDEVKAVCPPEHLAELKEWYNGYVFGETIIYNPWSVLKFFKSGFKYGPYWVNTGGNNLLVKYFRHKHMPILRQLLNKEPVTTRIDERMVFEELSDPNAFWSLLLMTGYVTYDKKYQIRVPNKEILDVLQKVVLLWYSGPHASMFFEEFLEAFLKGHKEVVERDLKKIIFTNLSFHDVAEDTQESFYHGLLLGFFVGLEGRYDVRSNRESGYGRYDIMLIPKDPVKDPGVVLECKVGKEATVGMLQMQNKAYATELKARGCTKILLYSLAFNGKNVEIVLADSNSS